MSIETGTESRAEFAGEARKPFAWISIAYAVVGSLVVLGFTPDPYFALSWFLIFFFTSIANLFFLSKVVAVTLDLMSHQGTEKGLYRPFHLLLYGALKFISLGTILVLVWKSETSPMLAKMTGLGALVAIPFFGGFWLSQRESYKDIRNAR